MKKLSDKILNFIENKYKKYYPNFKIGNKIKIYNIFKNFEKEPNNYFKGILFSIKNKGINKAISLKYQENGILINKNYFINSPKIYFKREKIEIKKKITKIRRSKLYFIKKE